MKAERRHELKTNTPGNKIIAGPDAGKKYAGPVVVAVALVLVVAFIIYRRSGSAVEARNDALIRLSEARRMVDDIRRPRGLDASSMRMVRDAYEGGKKLLSEVGTETDDAKLLAQAILLRGDMNLALYQLPIAPGATTNPALRPAGDTKPEALLADATAAYQDIVEHYADQPVSLANAYFGLATVAEDKGDFAKASEMYDKIAKNETFPQALRNLAKDRLDTVPKIQARVIFGDPDTEYHKPTTAKSTTEPTTNAATKAATKAATTTPHTTVTQPTMTQPMTTQPVPASKPTSAATTKPAK